MITRKAGAGARRRLHRGDQARDADAVSPRSRWPSSRERAGIPKGVLNVITGDAPAIGGELTTKPDRAQALVHRLDRGRQAC